MAEHEEMTVEEYRARYGEGGETGKRRNKFNAKPTVIDGIRFASMAESRRYRYLVGEQEAGRILRLSLQPRFTLIPSFLDPATGKTVRATVYTADFMYKRADTGQWVVEDVKGGKATEDRGWKVRWNLVRYKNRGIRFVTVQA